jgi:uncharacterized membrane protein YhaH (DUF805 family)
MRDDYSDLPAFVFPVLAWSPDPATGVPFADGVRCFRTPRDVVTIRWLDQQPIGWTFVDSEGRRWEVAAVRVIDRLSARLLRVFSNLIPGTEYRLAYEFMERSPTTVDEVRNRLLAAVRANPTFYRYGAGRQRRQQLLAAEQLSDLIVPEKTDEEYAIEHLQPVGFWGRWFFGEGRCSRRLFAATIAGLLALHAAIWTAWMVSPVGFVRPGRIYFAILLMSAIAFGSAIIRRLHDLRRSGWWPISAFAWGMVCAVIHDVFRDTGGAIVAGWLWWTPVLCVLACLAVLPGTPGPNRYGFGSQKDRQAATSVGDAPRST